MQVLEQFEVLKDFTRRLEHLGIQNMLTGSMAQGHYSIPRSTVDIDLVIALSLTAFQPFEREFGAN